MRSGGCITAVRAEWPVRSVASDLGAAGQRSDSGTALFRPLRDHAAGVYDHRKKTLAVGSPVLEVR
jgi:hypothetical protein